LAKEQNAPDIHFTVRKFVFTDSPLEEKFKEMELKPVHYDFSMKLVKIDSIPSFIEPSGIVFQNQKKISDTTSYLAVLNDAFSEQFDFRPLSRNEFKIIFEERWKEFDIEHWFAFEGNKLIGICTLIINPELNHIGTIQGLGVLHECHHRGIGRSLLGFGIQSLIKKGCTIIELGVEATNEKALTLYKTFGFNEVESLTEIFYTINN
jgi:ribosomal protein S18 acetylase RimI-like enzyme